MNSQYSLMTPQRPPKLLKLIDSQQFRSLNQFHIKDENNKDKAFMTKYVQKMKKNLNGETFTINRVINILKLHQMLRNQSQLELLKSFFDENFPYIGKFKDKLEGTKCLEIFKFMTVERYRAFNVIFRHGEIGRKMYFLLTGEVAIFIPRSKQSQEVYNLICHDFKDLVNIQFQEFSFVATKNFGDVFGEIAIEQRVSRTATVVAKTDVYVGLLSYEMYQDIIGKYQNIVIAQKLEFINQIPLFQDWEQKQKLIILSSFELQHRNCGSLIFQKGQIDDYIYLVISGEIEIIKSKQIQSQSINKNVFQQQTIALINSGQFFGDYEHLFNIPTRVTSARTKMETTFYKVKYSIFIELIEIYSNLEEFKQAQMVKFKIQENFSNKVDQVNFTKQSGTDNMDIDMNKLKQNYFLNQKLEKQKQELKKQIYQTNDHLKKDHYKNQIKKLSQTLSVHESTQLNKYSNLIPNKHDFFVNEEKCVQSSNRVFQQKFFQKMIQKVTQEQKPTKPVIPKFFEQSVKYHLASKYKNRKQTKSQNINSEQSQSDSISLSTIIKHKVAKLNLQTSNDSSSKLNLEKILRKTSCAPQTQLSLHIKSYHREHLRQNTNRSLQSKSHRILKQDHSDSRKILKI